MFGCCAMVPLVLFMIAGPILSAGKGWRMLLAVAGVELAVLGLLIALNFNLVMDAIDHWRSNPLVLVPFVLLLGPIGLGWLVVWVKKVEERGERGNFCRVCGYDLRASPDRCPECGTPVQYDSERFEEKN